MKKSVNKECVGLSDKGCEYQHWTGGDYDICEYCLLTEAGLLWKGSHDSCDQIGLGDLLYEEEDVVKALRMLRSQNEENNTP